MDFTRAPDSSLDGPVEQEWQTRILIDESEALCQLCKASDFACLYVLASPFSFRINIRQASGSRRK